MIARVYCNGTRAKCLREIELTAGMAGAPIAFEFSPEWDGLTKIAVFSSDGTKDRILDERGETTVPHEILTTPGMDVTVAVFARREDGTTWPSPSLVCRIGRVKFGADPSGDESYPPTPTVGEQAIALAGQASETANEVKSRADSGEFDGGYYAPRLEQEDGEAFQISFTPSKEGMPPVESQPVQLPKVIMLEKGEAVPDDLPPGQLVYIPDEEGITPEELVVLDVLTALGLAPVVLDDDGTLVTEDDGTVLLNL